MASVFRTDTVFGQQSKCKLIELLKHSGCEISKKKILQDNLELSKCEHVSFKAAFIKEYC